MQHCQVQVQFFNVANWHINVEPLLARVWTETDKQKMRKYYHLIDTKRSLAGHLLLQDMLQNCSNTKFITKRTKYDKPYLCYSNAEQNATHFINFNTSHSGDWVCTAILIVPLQYALPHCIGIDVEQVQIRGTSSESEFLSIFQSYFTAHEWKYIYECNTLQRFFTLWTLKESFIKTIGTGVSFGELSRIEFDISTTITVKVDGILQKDWYFFTSFTPDQKHAYSIAITNASAKYMDTELVQAMNMHKANMTSIDSKWKSISDCQFCEATWSATDMSFHCS